MRNLKYILLAISVLLSQISLASDAGGPPKAEDLIGFWKMVKWPDPNANKINPWPLPYQWFGFYKDGRLLSMMTTNDADYTTKQLAKIFSALQSESPKYQLDGQFLSVRHPNIEGRQELWGVNLFARNVGEVAEKGDLVMSLAGGNDGAPVYFRLLRKLK